MLNELFSLLCEAVINNGGVVDKFMGDGLMAVFGVPFVHSDDALRACRAALDMQAAVETFNRQRDGRRRPNEMPLR